MEAQNSSEELRQALAVANIPTLLMVLAQLTGDRKWIEGRYRPKRPRGLSDNDSGGLPGPLRQEVRDSALAVLTAWQNSGKPIPPPVAPDLFVEMMSVCVGEPVAAEYAPMMAEEMGITSRDLEWMAPAETGVRTLIVGAGFGGVCAAIKFERAGLDYDIVEKNSAIGGTWLENRYPGCGVDTPSHVYAFSFAPNHNWARYYARRDEIRAYLEGCAETNGIRERISFDTELVSATWDAERSLWRVVLRTADGAETTAAYNVLISAVGQLNRPKIPHINGLEAFRGPAFHSARWPAAIDLTDKRVAVIGTGASSMQIVTTIAETVGSLMLFQRSPQWAAPNANYRREVSDETRLLLETVPFYAAWYRFRLLWMFNDKVHKSLQVDPEWDGSGSSINATNDGHRRLFTDYIAAELGDRADLIEKVLPNYPPFGKRMLMDNGWFRTLTRDNVQLVTDSIAEVTRDAIITVDGVRHQVDVIVLATGFEALQLLAPMEIRGRLGRTLRDVWGDDNARAYLGLTVPEFPNLFCLYGPNTNLGHGGSITFHLECQVRYIIGVLREMIEQGMASVECRIGVHDAYNRRVDEAHERMIWTQPGVESWYRNEEGRIVTNSPWRLVDYWAMTHEPDLTDFNIELRERDEPTSLTLPLA